MKEKKILNVGCGNDTYGTHFVDLYPSRAEVISCNVDKEKLPFPDNFFDEVYSKNLLEHLRNPGFALEEMVRVLKPGGRLIVITDNASYIGFHLSIFGSRMHKGGYKGMGEEDVHYSLFTRHHLKNHLRYLGLENIRITLKDAYSRSFVSLIKKVVKILSKELAYPHILAVGIKKRT